VQIAGEHVGTTIDMAVAPDRIDEAKAAEALQRVAARLRGKPFLEEVSSINAALVGSLVQFYVKPMPPQRRAGLD
jgi:hypothetical protein